METTRGQSLTHAIAERVGRAIVSGGYSKGGFPTEGELARQLSVSRNVVREAVKILTAKGLLSARPRHGTSLEPIGAWNLLDPDVLRWLLNRELSIELLRAFTQMRLAVEPCAAAIAATRADPAGLAAVENAVARFRAALAGVGDPIAADVAFHVAVLEASGNPFFLQLRHLVETALRTSVNLTHGLKELDRSLAEHEGVAAAILSGDAVGASRAMQQMMLDVLDMLADMAKPNPAEDEGGAASQAGVASNAR
jgi:DNA-binding FadR family transcriptional regulator